MATSQEAIDRFLNSELPKRPDFKGMSVEGLRSMIRASTGAELAESKGEFRAHQLAGTAFAAYMRRSLLFYEPRMGKSKMALDWAMLMRKSKRWEGCGLVIAHSPLGLEVWRSMVEKFSNLRAVVVTTSHDEFLNAIEAEPDLIIMTWSGLEAIFTAKAPKRKGPGNELRVDPEALALAAECFDLAIIDEIHRCGDHTSLWLQLAAGIVAKCRFRLGMTGTPANKKPLMLWAQCFLVDGGRTLGTSFYFFQAAFCKKLKQYWRQGAFTWEFRKDLMPVLMRKVASLSLSYTRAEVQEEKIWEDVVHLRMTGEQLFEYNRTVRDLVDRKRKGAMGDEEQQIFHRENTFIKLRMISSGYMPFVDDQGRRRYVRFPQSAKRDYLRNLLSELGDDLPPMVIFHEYQETGRLLCDLLAELKIGHAWLYGGTKKSEKGSIIRDFQAGAFPILVSNTGTGGTGVDMNRADYLYYYETPTSPIIRRQSQDRPMGERNGRPLCRDDLVCSAVERQILDYLTQGKDMQAAFLLGRFQAQTLLERS